MIMVACVGLDKTIIDFAHRRAWIMIEIFAFWMNLLAMLILLTLKSRIFGGGVEIP